MRPLFEALKVFLDLPYCCYIYTLMKTLKDLRDDRGLSQTTVANAIESHQKTISAIELGNHYPGEKTIHKLAMFYEMSVGEIVLAARATRDEKIKLDNQLKSGGSEDTSAGNHSLDSA